MFRWYKESSKCYAYLSDVEGVENTVGELHWPRFRNSKWFT